MFMDNRAVGVWGLGVLKGVSLWTARVAVVVFVWAAGLGPALADPDYKGMVDRIDAFLSGAAESYRAGDAETAKTNVQRAYFEVFENLEGPIRVNISAKASYALEAEFGAIRKLVMAGAPPEEVAARTTAQIAAIRAVVPVLETGFKIKAHPAAGAEDEAAPNPTPALPQTIEPYWQRAVEAIGTDLYAAASALEAGKPDEAKALITRAQFSGYKNSLLETAVRRTVSQRQDIAFNAEFQRILGLVDAGKPPRMIRASADVLVEELTALLPGLPLVGIAKDQAAPAAEPEANWAAVARDVATRIESAIALAGDGKTSAAAGSIQDTYFDVFEASGMESRIGARDTAFKAQLEAHFSKIAALINQGADPATLTAAAEAMAVDMKKAVDMLGGGSSSPTALFFYALLIILREGVEAMLIVTAILTYLVKTGNRDRQGTIVNSVLVALACSVVTAVLLKLVFRASAASQEVLEGATMLVAAVILFTMSYWLVSKAEAQKWMAYIKGKVEGSLSSGSLKALWFTSFLAVYREGAETVLFYQALTLDADTTGLFAIAGGFAVGCVGLGVIYLVMRAGAMKLAIRPFFMITGALLYAMAFIFAGKGIMELVEGKIIEPTLVSWAPDLPMIGMFPYVESLAPQIALVVAAVIGLLVATRRRGPSPATP
ncbi:iron permease [Rhodospirillum rubrum]|nr:iron permease [Rhodospirillum rubrum]MBK1676726.1 iron permease [Rhodospirillum rubrum]